MMSSEQAVPYHHLGQLSPSVGLLLCRESGSQESRSTAWGLRPRDTAPQHNHREQPDRERADYDRMLSELLDPPSAAQPASSFRDELSWAFRAPRHRRRGPSTRSGGWPSRCAPTAAAFAAD